MTIFERIDVLMENGSILLQTGELRTSTMNFEAIAKKGISTSGRRVDTDTGKEVIRCSVPVVKDGHTVAILLGVVVCEDLPEIFTSSMYNGNTYVCLIDRITGDFIMDSWHDSLQNFYEMPNRKMLPKYQNVNLYEEVAEGNTGVVAYESNVNGKDSYMYYRPIQNLDWQIIIVAQDDVVFESLETMESSLAFMFITIGALSTGYLIWCIFILVKAMKNENMLIKNSYIDSLTGVFNQNKFFAALEEFEKTSINGVGMVFLDLNGLKYTNDHLGHNVGDILLKDTANILTKNFGSNVYRIGGDEFVTISTNISEELINTIAENVKLDMTEKNIEISMGVTWRPNSKTIKTQLKEADDLMYIDKRNYHNKDI